MLLRTTHNMVEPSGATAFAGLLAERAIDADVVAGKRVGVIMSGGNLDGRLLPDLLTARPGALSPPAAGTLTHAAGFGGGSDRRRFSSRLAWSQVHRRSRADSEAVGCDVRTGRRPPGRVADGVPA